MTESEKNIINWLLKGDPSIRWQVKRDLIGAPESEFRKDRSCIHREGWGKALMDQRQTDGRWGGGWYSPKWISTHYTLLLLKRLGLPPDNPMACESVRFLLRKGLYSDGGINLFSSLHHSETCVTGMILSLCAYFNMKPEEYKSLSGFLLEQQMEDGGWNCESFKGAGHSSMHTTISVLEGLWAFEQHGLNKKNIRRARMRAHEFLLLHRLYKSDRTGKVINPQWTRIPFPPRWHYDILRVLDYFRDCHADRDDRIGDAMEELSSKRKNGVWPMQAGYGGKTFFEIEKAGQPSRWNTLRAMRVREWWNAG